METPTNTRTHSLVPENTDGHVPVPGSATPGSAALPLAPIGAPALPQPAALPQTTPLSQAEADAAFARAAASVPAGYTPPAGYALVPTGTPLMGTPLMGTPLASTPLSGASLTSDPLSGDPIADGLAAVGVSAPLAVVTPQGQVLPAAEADAELQRALKTAQEAQRPQDQSVSSQSTPAQSTPTETKRFLPFKSARESAAGFVEYLGYKYWYREMPDTVEQWATERAKTIAAEAGISEEQLEAEVYRKLKPQELAKVAEEKRALYATFIDVDTAMIEKLPGYWDDILSYVCVHCLVDWDIPGYALTEANIRDMYKEPRTVIFQAVKYSTATGQSFETFRRQRH